MKSVLISIQPKRCELIASGKKTVEIRKTRPKIEPPVKCYIYCTVGDGATGDILPNSGVTCGKVIGEFVCDKIDYWNHHIHDDDTITLERASELSCVSEDDLVKYADLGHFYAWHISDLVIYDHPMELSEFRYYNVRAYICEIGYLMPTHEITRPPRSWCYVEEGGE